MKGMMHVIVKERKSPDFIQRMEALLRRLPASHSKRVLIENDLAKRKAGFRGEEAVDYFLKHLNEFTIIYDIRLAGGIDDFFQIDALLLYSNFILILEIKNISGTIYFDSAFNQLIQIKQDNERGFLNPLIQGQKAAKRANKMAK